MGSLDFPFSRHGVPDALGFHAECVGTQVDFAAVRRDPFERTSATAGVSSAEKYRIAQRLEHFSGIEQPLEVEGCLETVGKRKGNHWGLHGLYSDDLLTELYSTFPGCSLFRA